MSVFGNSLHPNRREPFSVLCNGLGRQLDSGTRRAGAQKGSTTSIPVRGCAKCGAATEMFAELGLSCLAVPRRESAANLAAGRANTALQKLSPEKFQSCDRIIVTKSKCDLQHQQMPRALGGSAGGGTPFRASDGPDPTLFGSI